MLRPDYPIRTPRLVLRPYALGDFDALHDIQSRPGVTRYLLFDTGALIGDVTLFWLSRANRQGEIGYVFHPDHSGQGYATEAARVLLRLGFEDLGLHRIIGRIDARNAPSARVL